MMTVGFFWRARWISSLTFDLCQCKESLKVSKGRERIWRCWQSPHPKGSEKVRPGHRQAFDRQRPEEVGNRREKGWQQKCWQQKGEGVPRVGVPEPSVEAAALVSTALEAPLHGSKRGPASPVGLLPNLREANVFLRGQLESCGRG